jgi:hypothetical protein
MAETVAVYAVPHTPSFVVEVQVNGERSQTAQFFSKIRSHLEEIRQDLLPLTITFPAMLLGQCSSWAFGRSAEEILTTACIVFTGGILMSTQDTNFFRQHHQDLGIPACDPFSAPRFQQRATEPQRREQPPWPRNLFGDLASIAELMAESAHVGENADGASSCGRRKEQKHNVPQKLRNPYGRSFDVIYFRSEAFARTGGTRSGGGERDGESEPRRAHQRTTS